MASWKWALKMAQFMPSGLRCGTLADSCSMCGVEEGMGVEDMAMEEGAEESDEEVDAKGELEDAALLLE